MSRNDRWNARIKEREDRNKRNDRIKGMIQTWDINGLRNEPEPLVTITGTSQDIRSGCYDILFTAVLTYRNHKFFNYQKYRQFIRFLIEDHKVLIANTQTLAICLLSGDLETAKYLKEKVCIKRIIPHEINRVCSPEAIRLAIEWGLLFPKYDIDEKEEHKQLRILVEDELLRNVGNYKNAMEIAVDHLYLDTIIKLVEKGVEFTEEHLKKVAYSRDYERVNQLRSRFEIPLVSLLPYIFSDDERGLGSDVKADMILHYHNVMGDVFVKWFIDSKAMDDFCVRSSIKVTEALLIAGIPLEEPIISYFWRHSGYQLDDFDIEQAFEKIKTVLELVGRRGKAPQVIKETLDIVSRKINPIVILEQFVGVYGAKQFSVYADELDLETRFADELADPDNDYACPVMYLRSLKEPE